MSSETEGLGTSILDAMACGKPVVGTRAGGIPEVVEDGVTGFVVPTHDPKALAKAITTLLREPERRARMGAAGLARVRERFTVERMVDGTRAGLRARPARAAGDAGRRGERHADAECGTRNAALDGRVAK